MVIRCPSCGEELEIEELVENSEIRCGLCNSTMLYRRKKILLLDTNEEFELEELIEKELEDETYFEEFY